MIWFIYLSAHSVRVVCRLGKRLISVAEADAAASAALFAQIPSTATIYILVDSAEDVYQTICLPHVTGRARQHMLARHLQTFAINHAYAAVSWQVRLTEGRRDDVYLFAAIQASDWLQTYLQHLQRTHLAAMTTVAMLVQREVALNKRATALWVTQSVGGVRLTLVARGQMLFTRLLNNNLVVADEISKTRQYLVNHQLLSASESESLPIQSYNEDMLTAFARDPQLLNFATPVMLQAYKRARGQQIFVTAMRVVIILGLSATIYLYQQNQQLAAQWQGLASVPVPAIMPVATGVPARVNEMQASVALAQELRHAPDPVVDLAWLSTILTHYPSLQITHLTWRAATGGSLVIGGEVRPFTGSDVVAHTEVEAFITALRNRARVSAVQAFALPMNSNPQLVMHGGATQSAAKFELQVSLRGGI